MANEATKVFLLLFSLSLGMDSEMLPSKQRADCSLLPARKKDFFNFRNFKLGSKKEMLGFLLSCILSLCLLGGFETTEDIKSILSRVG